MFIGRKTNRRAIALFIGMACCLLLPATVAALTLIPPSIELGLNPGQKSQTSIKLFNETADTVELYPEPRSFTAKGETGQPSFDFSTPVEGLASWITVEPGPIVLKPNERYEVPLTITPPANADPGGHYASVFFSTAPPKEGAGQVHIASKVGTLLLTRVAGTVTETGSISEFQTTSGRTIFTRPPVEFFVRYENSGNVHLRPTGTVTITNMFGKVAGTADFNAGNGATLPKSVRRYDIKWEKAQVNGSSSFWSEYGNEKSNFGFGRYTAKLSISAGTSVPFTKTATLVFWLFPWHVILIWALGVVVVVVVLFILIKRYNAWIIKKAAK